MQTREPSLHLAAGLPVPKQETGLQPALADKGKAPSDVEQLQQSVLWVRDFLHNINGPRDLTLLPLMGAGEFKLFSSEKCGCG